MTFDSVLKTLGIRSKSLAEKVNDRVISGYVPSDMARTIAVSYTHLTLPTIYSV